VIADLILTGACVTPTWRVLMPVLLIN
jgi:hypothetical protein